MALVVLLAAAPGASAGTPVLDSLGVEDGAVAGSERTFVLGASDPDAPVSGAVLSFEGEGVGSSACRTGDPAPAGGPFDAGSRVVVALPHVFGGAGTGEGAVRVDSGGCAAPTGSLLQPFAATVVEPGRPPRPLALGTPTPLPGGPHEPPELPPLVELPPRSPLDELPLGLQARRCRGARARIRRSARSRRRARLAIRCMLNRERRRRGLPRLGANGRLLRAASAHSRAMVRRGFFSHFGTLPPGQTLEQRLRRTHYLPARRWVVGENLAWGTRRRSTPASVFHAWMHSTSHRANILHPSFRDIGIGIKRGTPISRKRGVTYATNFGRKR